MELTLQLADAGQRRYKRILFDPELAAQLLVQLYAEAQATPLTEIVLDLDATDDPLPGKQEGQFSLATTVTHCYLPLSVCAGDHLLCARLRTADQDGIAGALNEVERIVE